jgi:hypothetical protein
MKLKNNTNTQKQTLNKQNKNNIGGKATKSTGANPYTQKT